MNLYRVVTTIYGDGGSQTHETQIAADDDAAAESQANAWADHYACGLNHSNPVVDPIELPDGVCLIASEHKALLEQVVAAVQAYRRRPNNASWRDVRATLTALEKPTQGPSPDRNNSTTTD